MTSSSGQPFGDVRAGLTGRQVVRRFDTELRATGTSVDECSTTDKAIVTATKSKTSSLSGIPDCRAISPQTTEANPFGGPG